MKKEKKLAKPNSEEFKIWFIQQRRKKRKAKKESEE